MATDQSNIMLHEWTRENMSRQFLRVDSCVDPRPTGISTTTLNPSRPPCAVCEGKAFVQSGPTGTTHPTLLRSLAVAVAWQCELRAPAETKSESSPFKRLN
eukprot:1461364-Amphidinium_carterae.1